MSLSIQSYPPYPQNVSIVMEDNDDNLLLPKGLKDEDLLDAHDDFFNNLDLGSPPSAILGPDFGDLGEFLLDDLLLDPILNEAKMDKDIERILNDPLDGMDDMPCSSKRVQTMVQTEKMAKKEPSPTPVQAPPPPPEVPRPSLPPLQPKPSPPGSGQMKFVAVGPGSNATIQRKLLVPQGPTVKEHLQFQHQQQRMHERTTTMPRILPKPTMASPRQIRDHDYGPSGTKRKAEWTNPPVPVSAPLASHRPFKKIIPRPTTARLIPLVREDVASSSQALVTTGRPTIQRAQAVRVRARPAPPTRIIQPSTHQAYVISTTSLDPPRQATEQQGGDNSQRSSMPNLGPPHGPTVVRVTRPPPRSLVTAYRPATARPKTVVATRTVNVRPPQSQGVTRVVQPMRRVMPLPAPQQQAVRSNVPSPSRCINVEDLRAYKNEELVGLFDQRGEDSSHTEKVIHVTAIAEGDMHRTYFDVFHRGREEVTEDLVPLLDKRNMSRVVITNQRPAEGERVMEVSLCKNIMLMHYKHPATKKEMVIAREMQQSDARYNLPQFVSFRSHPSQGDAFDTVLPLFMEHASLTPLQLFLAYGKEGVDIRGRPILQTQPLNFFIARIGQDDSSPVTTSRPAFIMTGDKSDPVVRYRPPPAKRPYVPPPDTNGLSMPSVQEELLKAMENEKEVSVAKVQLAPPNVKTDFRAPSSSSSHHPSLGRHQAVQSRSIVSHQPLPPRSSTIHRQMSARMAARPVPPTITRLPHTGVPLTPRAPPPRPNNPTPEEQPPITHSSSIDHPPRPFLHSSSFPHSSFLPGEPLVVSTAPTTPNEIAIASSVSAFPALHSLYSPRSNELDPSSPQRPVSAPSAAINTHSPMHTPYSAGPFPFNEAQTTKKSPRRAVPSQNGAAGEVSFHQQLEMERTHKMEQERMLEQRRSEHELHRYAQMGQRTFSQSSSSSSSNSSQSDMESVPPQQAMTNQQPKSNKHMDEVHADHKLVRLPPNCTFTVDDVLNKEKLDVSKWPAEQKFLFEKVADQIPDALAKSIILLHKGDVHEQAMKKPSPTKKKRKEESKDKQPQSSNASESTMSPRENASEESNHTPIMMELPPPPPPAPLLPLPAPEPAQSSLVHEASHVPSPHQSPTRPPTVHAIPRSQPQVAPQSVPSPPISLPNTQSPPTSQLPPVFDHPVSVSPTSAPIPPPRKKALPSVPSSAPPTMKRAPANRFASANLHLPFPRRAEQTVQGYLEENFMYGGAKRQKPKPRRNLSTMLPNNEVFSSEYMQQYQQSHSAFASHPPMDFAPSSLPNPDLRRSHSDPMQSLAFHADYFRPPVPETSIASSLPPLQGLDSGPSSNSNDSIGINQFGNNDIASFMESNEAFLGQLADQAAQSTYQRRTPALAPSPRSKATMPDRNMAAKGPSINKNGKVTKQPKPRAPRKKPEGPKKPPKRRAPPVVSSNSSTIDQSIAEVVQNHPILARLLAERPTARIPTQLDSHPPVIPEAERPLHPAPNQQRERQADEVADDIQLINDLQHESEFILEYNDRELIDLLKLDDQKNENGDEKEIVDTLFETCDEVEGKIQEEERAAGNDNPQSKGNTPSCCTSLDMQYSTNCIPAPMPPMKQMINPYSPLLLQDSLSEGDMFTTEHASSILQSLNSPLLREATPPVLSVDDIDLMSLNPVEFFFDAPFGVEPAHSSREGLVSSLPIPSLSPSDLIDLLPPPQPIHSIPQSPIEVLPPPVSKAPVLPTVPIDPLPPPSVIPRLDPPPRPRAQRRPRQRLPTFEELLNIDPPPFFQAGPSPQSRSNPSRVAEADMTEASTQKTDSEQTKMEEPKRTVRSEEEQAHEEIGRIVASFKKEEAILIRRDSEPKELVEVGEEDKSKEVERKTQEEKKAQKEKKNEEVEKVDVREVVIVDDNVESKKFYSGVVQRSEISDLDMECLDRLFMKRAVKEQDGIYTIYFLRRNLRLLTLKNYNLSDQLEAVREKIKISMEQRSALARRLLHFERNHLRRVTTNKKKKLKLREVIEEAIKVDDTMKIKEIRDRILMPPPRVPRVPLSRQRKAPAVTDSPATKPKKTPVKPKKKASPAKKPKVSPTKEPTVSAALLRRIEASQKAQPKQQGTRVSSRIRNRLTQFTPANEVEEESSELPVQPEVESATSA